MRFREHILASREFQEQGAPQARQYHMRGEGPLADLRPEREGLCVMVPRRLVEGGDRALKGVFGKDPSRICGKGALVRPRAERHEA